MDKRLIRFLLKRPATWLACSQAVLAKGLKKNTVVIRRQGLKILTGTGNGQGLFCALAGTEYEDEMAWFLDQMNPGDTFVDVGANIGLYALHASRRVGPSGKIHAFEPTEETFGILTENIRLNRFSNILPVRTALSDRTGTLYLVSDNRPASNSTSSEASPSANTVAIEAITLDQYGESHPHLKVDFIKVDIEGGEAAFFKGGEKTILRDKPLILFESMHTGPLFPERKLLYDLGYELYTLEGSALKIAGLDTTTTANLIARHPQNQ